MSRAAGCMNGSSDHRALGRAAMLNSAVKFVGALPRAIAPMAHAACIVICALGVTSVANVEYGA